VTNAKSSQNNRITTTEMCDAAVTKVRFDRVQFISRASVPFSLPDSTIELIASFTESEDTASAQATTSVAMSCNMSDGSVHKSVDQVGQTASPDVTSLSAFSVPASVEPAASSSKSEEMVSRKKTVSGATVTKSSHRVWDKKLACSGVESEAGHFIVETVELRAAFAASSARSLPRIPV